MPQSPWRWSLIISDVVALAIVALIEHMANVALYGDMYDYRTDPASELIAVGVSNILGGMFGSFATAGGFSRTALNKNAHSQMSQVMSVFMSLLIVFVAAGPLSMLPATIVQVILFLAVVSLIDVQSFLKLWKMGKYGAWELIALLAAFFLTCFFGVILGMVVSVIISVLGFIYQSTQADVVQLEREIGTLHYAPIKDASTRRHGDSNVKILKFETALWFANCHRFADAIKEETNFKKEKPWSCKGLV